MFAVNANRPGPFPGGQTYAEIQAAELAQASSFDDSNGELGLGNGASSIVEPMDGHTVDLPSDQENG